MLVGIIATIVAVSSDNRVAVITAVPAAAIAVVLATAAPEALQQTHQFLSPGPGIVK